MDVTREFVVRVSVVLRFVADCTQAQEFERKYAREMEIRKRLHNNLVDMQGKIRVFCRIRPIIALEQNKVLSSCVRASQDISYRE